jgi:hypothetical protein
VRKLFAIVAFACLLFLNVGYFVFYQLRLAEIKAEMKKEVLRSRRSELTRFKFSAKETASLEWEEDTEFRFKDEMYDVVSREDRGDTTTILCLSDKKENELKKLFANNLGKSTGKTSSAGMIKLLSAPYLFNDNVFLLIEELAAQQKTSFYLFNLPLYEPYVLIPPPKIC